MKSAPRSDASSAAVAFVFRRDLRLQDNPMLDEALRKGAALFLLIQPEQTNERQTQLMREVAGQLAKELGREIEICVGVKELLGKLVSKANDKRQRVYMNWLPFGLDAVRALKAEPRVELLYGRMGAEPYYDCLLFGQPALKADSTAYKKYTPFFEHCLTLPVVRPDGLQLGPGPSQQQRQTAAAVEASSHRAQALHLARMPHSQSQDYWSLTSRDQLLGRSPHARTSSQLSTYLTLGVLSPREAVYLCRDAEFHRQVLWREFYYCLSFADTALRDAGPPAPFDNAACKPIDWTASKRPLERWAAGQTGQPAVDAAMQQLAAVGWLHNRARLIVASYLINDLQTHWQHGERHFARLLLDFDPILNNYNWQWVAGCGPFSQPHFRTLSVERQSKHWLG